MLLGPLGLSAQTTTPGSRFLPPVPNFTRLLSQFTCGTKLSTTFLNGLGCWATPAGAGNVSGPVSSTNGFIPTWSGTSGTVLASGLPVGNSGNSTVLETDGSGHIPSSTIVNVVTGPGSSTDGNVARWSGTSGQILATGTPVGNSGANNIMQADSGGHLDSSVIPVLTGHAGALTTGSAPSPSTGATDCGTTPSVAGNDQVGRVTVGSSANGGHCTITFVTSWTNPPVCSVWNETSGLRPVWPQPTQTTLVILGVYSASTSSSGGTPVTYNPIQAADTLAYSCREYQ